ncbi:MAG TPA: hypothetical protein EYP41_16575 [Anaerolineae bacterium]|nr:hypothetical protein [Anaerolineae bacterium]HIP71297.1 hypothetical protein [Anaerolineae bacterium]
MILRILGGLFVILLVIAGILTAIAVVIGWSYGIGWAIAQFLPFTLFETTLLGMLASIFIFFLGSRILSVLLSEGEQTMETSHGSDQPLFMDHLLEEEGIPAGRFVQSEGGETDEAWFRYQIANDIYDDLLSKLDLNATMGETQVKELAVRLTDVVTAVFKARPKKPRSQRVTITVAQLKKQMDKTGLRPYDNDILKTTVGAVNKRLSFDDELADIVRQKTWNDIY